MVNKLNIDAVKQHLVAETAVLMDGRLSEAFATEHIPGSISLPFSGHITEKFSSIIDPDTPIILTGAEKDDFSTALVFVQHCGFQNIIGVFPGGIQAWKQSGEKIDLLITIDADELALDLPHDPALLPVDVRSREEFEAGHLPDAFFLPTEDLSDHARIAMLPDEANLYLYCSDGSRSIMAASILKMHGIHNLRVVLATWDQIKEIGEIEITNTKDVSKLN